MSFLDYLLANDRTGELHAMAAADQAELDSGITWGVYDRGRLLCTYPARYMADAEARDCADATNRPVTDFQVQLVADEQAQVAA